MGAVPELPGGARAGLRKLCRPSATRMIAKTSLNRGTPRGLVMAPLGVRNNAPATLGFRRRGWLNDKAWESKHEAVTVSFLVEIVAETLPVVLVFVAIDAEILPVGAIYGVIPGIPVLVVHR